MNNDVLAKHLDLLSVHLGMGNVRLEKYKKISANDNIKIRSFDTSGCFSESIDLSMLNFKLNIIGHENFVYISDGVKLNGAKFQIKGRGCYIFIGENCRLNNVTLSVKGKGSIISIGNNTTWESGVAICDDSTITIGEDGMISNDVMLRTSDGHGIFDMADKELVNKPAPIVIARHVWLGNGSRVNKGTTICENTVLGGMSVATGVLSSGSIYAGIPAKLLRDNISWSRTYNYNDIPEEYR